jgi:hypothetical protein
MRIAFLIIVLLALLGGVGGFLFIGMHPPQPHVHTVDHTLSNDQFQTH